MKNLAQFILLVFGLFSTTFVIAQNANDINENSDFRDRVFIGGNLGLSFGDITNIQIAPIIGYRVTNEFAVGLGPQYQYTRIRLNRGSDVTSNNYGFNAFARYNLVQPFFAQVEYEYLNFEFIRLDLTTTRSNFSSVLIGGGISQPIGSRAFFNLTVLYNVLYDQNDLESPYDSPLVIRAGINLGF
ncbi:MAG: hypothetical protein AAFN93_24565 [Bacteroidota bacterium]